MDDATTLNPSERRALEANILKSYAFSLLNNFQLWMPIWIVYLIDQRGLSLTEVTALETPFFLTQVLAEVPTGAIADHFGRKASLLLSSLVTAVAVLTFGMATTFLFVLGSYVVWGIGASFRSGADTALLYDSLKALGREVDFATVQGRQLALNWGAVLVAGLVGAPLAAATSLATPVLLSAAIVAASAPIAMSFYEPPTDRAGRPSYWKTMGGGLAYTWRRATVRYGVLFTTIVAASFYAPNFFVQPFLKGHGASIASLGLFMVPLRLMSIAGNLAAPRAQSKLGLWPMLFLAPPLAAAAGFTLAGWDSLYAFAVLPGVFLVNSTRNVLLLNYLNLRIPSETRATVLSAANLVMSLAMAMIAPVFGAVADGFSLRTSFAASAAVGITLLPIAMAVWFRADRAERKAESEREGAPAVFVG